MYQASNSRDVLGVGDLSPVSTRSRRSVYVKRLQSPPKKSKAKVRFDSWGDFLQHTIHKLKQLKILCCLVFLLTPFYKHSISFSFFTGPP